MTKETYEHLKQQVEKAHEYGFGEIFMAFSLKEAEALLLDCLALRVGESKITHQ